MFRSSANGSPSRSSRWRARSGWETPRSTRSSTRSRSGCWPGRDAVLPGRRRVAGSRPDGAHRPGSRVGSLLQAGRRAGQRLRRAASHARARHRPGSHAPAGDAPRVAVIGAGAAGTLAAIFAATAGRRDAAARAHRRRRPQDPHQRRRPLQHPAGARGRAPLRHRLVAPLPAQHPPLLAARRADRVLRARAGPAAGRGDGVGQAVPRLQPRARRAGRPARAGARRRGARFLPNTPVTDLVPGDARLAGARRGRRAARGGRRGRRHRRALGAEHRERRHRPRDPPAPGPRRAPDLRGAHADHATPPAPSRRSPASRCRSPSPRGRTARQRLGDRRVPVHPSRLQRPVGARRVARADAGGGPERHAARLQVQWTALDEDGWDRRAPRRGDANRRRRGPPRAARAAGRRAARAPPAWRRRPRSPSSAGRSAAA